jgi:hypothetical protein
MGIPRGKGDDGKTKRMGEGVEALIGANLIGAGHPAARGTRKPGLNERLGGAVASLRSFRSVLQTEGKSAFDDCDLMFIETVNKVDIGILSIRSSWSRLFLASFFPCFFRSLGPVPREGEGKSSAELIAAAGGRRKRLEPWASARNQTL